MKRFPALGGSVGHVERCLRVVKEPVWICQLAIIEGKISGCLLCHRICLRQR
jgi:hypothetical protein